MHADFFLDTNILLYAASSAKAEHGKRVRARELLSMEGGGLSVQVQAEFYVNATAKFKLPHGKVIRILESLESYPVLAITEALFWAAMRIKERYGLSYWDSAIIAAALELGCHTVYTEDLNHGQSYAGIRVINPFVA
ncbi:MAG: PIN domain-containing protein [Verrucomicrobia bacterium]|nr:PIN domain-containing protein [Verrucomicrobiota bacterium]